MFWQERTWSSKKSKCWSNAAFYLINSISSAELCEPGCPLLPVGGYRALIKISMMMGRENNSREKEKQGLRGSERKEGLDWGEGGREGCIKMPASAVKPVWALCSECVRTWAHWRAFAQSAVTPFKVTVSWGEHPHRDQCPASMHAYFTLLLCLLQCPPPIDLASLSPSTSFICPFRNHSGHTDTTLNNLLFFRCTICVGLVSPFLALTRLSTVSITFCRPLLVGLHCRLIMCVTPTNIK